jgi:uncharacterized protein YndB with AHSA1/START domain
MAKQIVVSRVFNAPVELVWQIWTDAELVKRWWGPKQYTAPVAEIDFREGGKSVVSMRAPQQMGGQEYYSIWEYQKIVYLQSIEFIQNLSDRNGNKTEPVKVGMPADFPLDIRTVVAFQKLSEQETKMTVTQFADMGQMRAFAQLGLEQSVEKMAAIFTAAPQQGRVER